MSTKLLVNWVKINPELDVSISHFTFDENLISSTDSNENVYENDFVH
jgi:hypothetical protein